VAVAVVWWWWRARGSEVEDHGIEELRIRSDVVLLHVFHHILAHVVLPLLGQCWSAVNDA
jgi:hypothetical protein